MAYLHCHGCGWSQDDFWHHGYSAVYSDVWKWYHELLIGNKQYIVNEDGSKTDVREFVAKALENCAKEIRNMRWPREVDWKFGEPARKPCPRCGSSSDWDID